jgi:hypothetical protein
MLLNDTFSEDCRYAITKGMQWPHAMAFPILDVLRSAAIKSPSLNPVQFVSFDALHLLAPSLWRIFDIPIQAPTQYSFAKHKLVTSGSALFKLLPVLPLHRMGRSSTAAA